MADITSWTPGQGAALLPSNAKTPHDNLALPDGRKLGDVGNDLASVLLGLEVPGVSAENGRSQNVEAYARHLQNMREEAGHARVASWLASPKGSA